MKMILPLSGSSEFFKFGENCRKVIRRRVKDIDGELYEKDERVRETLDSYHKSCKVYVPFNSYGYQVRLCKIRNRDV